MTVLTSQGVILQVIKQKRFIPNLRGSNVLPANGE